MASDSWNPAYLHIRPLSLIVLCIAIWQLLETTPTKGGFQITRCKYRPLCWDVLKIDQNWISNQRSLVGDCAEWLHTAGI